jgi:membrane-bound lytic murein transglycosylase A
MIKKLAACLLVLAGCSSSPTVTQTPAPVPVRPKVHSLPATLIGEDHQQQEALQAFLNSCPRLGMQWQGLCWQAQRTAKTPAAAARFFQQNFDEYELEGGDGLLTGYMEAQLRCSWRPTARLNYPVYGTPADLRKGVPYLTRRQIETTPSPALQRSVLMYCDKFDAYSLGVQGSGRVVLPDNSTVKLTYATKNNHGYTSIGRVLIDAGEVPREQMSMQAIKRWVQQNPDRTDWLFQQNESYVFYDIDRRQEAHVGPPGAMALKAGLTPYRSVAVDSRHIPLGTPLKIRSQWPDQTPFSRVVIAQDKGGAIKGRVRADLFLGHGDLADELAGRLQSPLDLRILWPKRWTTPSPEWMRVDRSS